MEFLYGRIEERKVEKILDSYKTIDLSACLAHALLLGYPRIEITCKNFELIESWEVGYTTSFTRWWLCRSANFRF